MKPMYAHRKVDLLNHGFLPSETRALITLPLHDKSLRIAKRERLKLFLRAADEGWTRQQYENFIMDNCNV